MDTGRDQASLWRIINNGLSRGGDGAPVADPGLSAEAFVDYFRQKGSGYQIRFFFYYFFVISILVILFSVRHLRTLVRSFRSYL